MASRILIGCPTSSHKAYCLGEYARAVKAIKALNDSDVDILLVDNSSDDLYVEKIKQFELPVMKGPWHVSARERIVQSRNLLREFALEHDYDYFFSLEQDVIPSADALRRLVGHKKRIVTGVVFNNLPWTDTEFRSLPMIYVQHTQDPEGLWYAGEKDLAQQFISVKASGLGCILIHRDVLKKITFRYTGGFDDMMFCKDATDLGFTIWCDTTVRPKHLHMSWEGIEK